MGYKKEFNLKLEFYDNGRLKSLDNSYNSEYGSISDVITDDMTDRIIKIIRANRENTEKEHIYSIKEDGETLERL